MTASGDLRFEWRGATPWLFLDGEIDVDTVESITDALLADFQTDGPLVVDAQGVTFVDSIGIGLLLRLRQIAASVQLLGASPEVMRVLELCGVAGLFEVVRADGGAAA